jgi:hypothetical protein
VLGHKHHLSPAPLFYTSSASLDSRLAHNYPYLQHVNKDYYNLIQYSSNVAWITQQLVTNQRNKEEEERTNKWNKNNKNFKNQKIFRTGDMVLLERHHKPGLFSKLRPRGHIRFKVVDQTDTCIYAWPWSK